MDGLTNDNFKQFDFHFGILPDGSDIQGKGGVTGQKIHLLACFCYLSAHVGFI